MVECIRKLIRVVKSWLIIPNTKIKRTKTNRFERFSFDCSQNFSLVIVRVCWSFASTLNQSFPFIKWEWEWWKMEGMKLFLRGKFSRSSSPNQWWMYVTCLGFDSSLFSWILYRAPRKIPHFNKLLPRKCLNLVKPVVDAMIFPNFLTLIKNWSMPWSNQGLKKQQNSRSVIFHPSSLLLNSSRCSEPYSARVTQACHVKLGTPIDVLNGRTDLSQSARRLEVLKQCSGFIFTDKIAEAKKVRSRSALLLSLSDCLRFRPVVRCSIQSKVMKMRVLLFATNWPRTKNRTNLDWTINNSKWLAICSTVLLTFIVIRETWKRWWHWIFFLGEFIDRWTWYCIADVNFSHDISSSKWWSRLIEVHRFSSSSSRNWVKKQHSSSTQKCNVMLCDRICNFGKCPSIRMFNCQYQISVYLMKIHLEHRKRSPLPIPPIYHQLKLPVIPY